MQIATTFHVLISMAVIGMLCCTEASFAQATIDLETTLPQQNHPTTITVVSYGRPPDKVPLVASVYESILTSRPVPSGHARIFSSGGFYPGFRFLDLPTSAVLTTIGMTDESTTIGQIVERLIENWRPYDSNCIDAPCIGIMVIELDRVEIVDFEDGRIVDKPWLSPSQNEFIARLTRYVWDHEDDWINMSRMPDALEPPGEIK